MAREGLNLVVHQLRRLAGVGAAKQATDADLLDQFVTHRHQAAFESLVRKHGPLVWSVCRRLLDQDHDAEDVFQATFLVLASRAGSIRKRESLGNWLYGVAYRLARRFRSEQTYRRMHEKGALPIPSTDPAHEAEARESAQLLGDEVQRLPEKYRVPVVLCYLAGRSHEQAAAECGWPVGTLKTRLRRALQLLAKRLARRGLVLPAGLAASLCAESQATALVPAGLRSLTVQTAVHFASGRMAMAGSRTAVRLAQEALQTLMLIRLRTVALLLLAGVLLAGGGILANAQRVESPPMEQQRMTKLLAERGERGQPPEPIFGRLPNELLPREPRPFVHPTPPEAIAFSSDWKWVLSGSVYGPLHLWKADTGEEIRRFTGHESHGRSGAFFIALSPDGKLAAALSHSDFQVHVWETATGKQIAQFESRLESGYPGIRFLPSGELFFNSVIRADSNLPQPFATDVTTAKSEQRTDYRFSVWNPASKRAREILPGVSGRFVISADGKVLATLPPPRPWLQKGSPVHPIFEEDVSPMPSVVRVWDIETGRALASLTYYEPVYERLMAFSPDGKALLNYGRDYFVHIRDVRSGKEWPSLNLRAWPCALSPDGKTLASAWGGDAVEIWDLEGRRLLHRLERGGASGMTFSPDGKVFATCGSDCRIHFWEVASGKER